MKAIVATNAMNLTVSLINLILVLLALQIYEIIPKNKV